MAKWMDKIFGLENFEDSEEYKKQEEEIFDSTMNNIDELNKEMTSFLENIENGKKRKMKDEGHEDFKINDSDFVENADEKKDLKEAYNEEIDFDDLEINDNDEVLSFDDLELDGDEDSIELESEEIDDFINLEEFQERTANIKSQMKELQKMFKKAKINEQREQILKQMQELSSQINLRR